MSFPLLWTFDFSRSIKYYVIVCIETLRVSSMDYASSFGPKNMLTSDPTAGPSTLYMIRSATVLPQNLNCRPVYRYSAYSFFISQSFNLFRSLYPKFDIFDNFFTYILLKMFFMTSLVERFIDNYILNT